LLLSAGAILIAADQVIKYWAVTHLQPLGSMDFIKIGGFDVLGFYYTENTGAAFSSFGGMRYFLIVLNIVLMAGLLVFAARSKQKHVLTSVSVMLILSGGVGNLIDRVRLGYVVDYFEVRLFDFAIFNFADMCIVIGAFLLAFHTVFLEIKTNRSKRGE
jgi:signal peptidase II